MSEPVTAIVDVRIMLEQPARRYRDEALADALDEGLADLEARIDADRGVIGDGRSGDGASRCISPPRPPDRPSRACPR